MSRRRGLISPPESSPESFDSVTGSLTDGASAAAHAGSAAVSGTIVEVMTASAWHVLVAVAFGKGAAVAAITASARVVGVPLVSEGALGSSASVNDPTTGAASGAPADEPLNSNEVGLVAPMIVSAGVVDVPLGSGLMAASIEVGVKTVPVNDVGVTDAVDVPDGEVTPAKRFGQGRERGSGDNSTSSGLCWTTPRNSSWDIPQRESASDTLTRLAATSSIIDRARTSSSVKSGGATFVPSNAFARRTSTNCSCVRREVSASSSSKAAKRMRSTALARVRPAITTRRTRRSQRLVPPPWPSIVK